MRIFYLLSLLLVLGKLAAGQSAECSVEAAAGSYGFIGTGAYTQLPFGLPVGPSAVINRIQLDGQGGYTATFAQSFSGFPLPPSTSSGTYTVNPDCTGTATDALGVTFTFVTNADGTDFRLLQTNSGSIVSGVAKAIRGECSIEAVAGRFNYSFQGLVIQPGGLGVPLTGVGRATIEADGTVAVKDNTSVGGVLAERTFSTSLQVKPDCTFTMDLPDGAQAYGLFVDDHREMIFILANAGAVGVGSGRK